MRPCMSAILTGLALALTAAGGGTVSAETFPVVLSNMSGKNVDYALGDGAVFTGTSWIVIQTWQTRQMHVKQTQYLFYRHTATGVGWHHYWIGRDADDTSRWRFTPGSSSYPTLQKDAINVPTINGAWRMGGPYNVGKPCKIIQKGTLLTFINENGNSVRGYFKNEKTVIAVGWNNLYGDLTTDYRRINWRNHTWWIR